MDVVPIVGFKNVLAGPLMHLVHSQTLILQLAIDWCDDELSASKYEERLFSCFENTRNTFLFGLGMNVLIEYWNLQRIPDFLILIEDLA